MLFIRDKMGNFAWATHLALDSTEDERFHDEFGLRNTIPLKDALLLMGFLTHNKVMKHSDWPKGHSVHLGLLYKTGFKKKYFHGTKALNQTDGVFSQPAILWSTWNAIICFKSKFSCQNKIELKRTGLYLEAACIHGVIWCHLASDGVATICPNKLSWQSNTHTHHRKHFGELRGGAGEHRGHDEVQERHQL